MSFSNEPSMSRTQMVLKAREIVARADAEGRRMTKDEMDSVRRFVDKVNNADMLDEIEKLGTIKGATAGMAGEIQRKGFDLTKAVDLDPSAAFGISVKTLGDADEASILRPAGILEEGLDRRYIYPNLAARNPGSATSVDVLVSDQRDLFSGSDAVPEDAVDDIDSTSEKNVTDSGASLQHTKLKRVATVSGYYPNAIVGLDSFRQLVDGDMRSAIREALDAYVTAALADGAGVDSTTGSDTYEQLRMAMTAIMGNGFSPNLAAISPGDAEDLDLERGSAEKAFILPPAPRDSQASPLWGMKVVIAKNVQDGEPIVMDTSGVEFYLGNLTFAADALTEFSTNQSRFRLEGPTLLVVRQPGAVASAGGSS